MVASGETQISLTGMAGGLRHNIEAQLREAEGIDEGIDHPHRIVGADRLVEPLRKECRLIAVLPLHESRHASPRSGTASQTNGARRLR